MHAFIHIFATWMWNWNTAVHTLCLSLLLPPPPHIYIYILCFHMGVKEMFSFFPLCRCEIEMFTFSPTQVWRDFFCLYFFCHVGVKENCWDVFPTRVWKSTVHTFFHAVLTESCQLTMFFFLNGCEREQFTLFSTWVWWRCVHTFFHVGVRDLFKPPPPPPPGCEGALFTLFSTWVWKRSVHTFIHVGVNEICSHFPPPTQVWKRRVLSWLDAWCYWPLLPAFFLLKMLPTVARTQPAPAELLWSGYTQ